jgi:hypothetical protein
MNTDQPTEGVDMAYGSADAQHLRFWKSKSPIAPIVLFVHSGSWRSWTYLDSIGSTKLAHLTSQGYAFATVYYALIPSATLEAAGTDVALHVFEGESFEGHMQMLLRLGDPIYSATLVMDNWLKVRVPVSIQVFDHFHPSKSAHHSKSCRTGTVLLPKKVISPEPSR